MDVTWIPMSSLMKPEIKGMGGGVQSSGPTLKWNLTAAAKKDVFPEFDSEEEIRSQGWQWRDLFPGWFQSSPAINLKSDVRSEVTPDDTQRFSQRMSLSLTIPHRSGWGVRWSFFWVHKTILELHHWSNATQRMEKKLKSSAWLLNQRC